MAKIIKTDERLIDANGIQLAYDAFGNPDDPPIMLVMGLGMQMLAGDELFCEHLAMRGYWVIRFDNRDIGRSTKLDTAGRPGLWQLMSAGLFHRPMSAPCRLKDMAVDTAGLMDALDIRAAHIVGVSMGGMIAQEMAIAHSSYSKTSGQSSLQFLSPMHDFVMITFMFSSLFFYCFILKIMPMDRFSSYAIDWKNS